MTVLGAPISLSRAMECSLLQCQCVKNQSHDDRGDNRQEHAKHPELPPGFIDHTLNQQVFLSGFCED